MTGLEFFPADEKKALLSLSSRYGALLIIFFLNRTLVSVLLLSLFGGSSLISDAKTYDGAYAAVMVLNDIISYAVPLAACALLLRDKPDTDMLKPYARFPLETVLLFIFAVSVSLNGSYVFSLITEKLCELFGAQAPQKAFSSLMPQTDVQFLVFLFCSGVIAPVCEELIFRKYLVAPLRRYGDLTAMIVSAVIFSLYHANIDQLAYTLLFGFVLALAAVRSGRILPLIIMHSLNNILVCFTQYYPAGGAAKETLSALSPFYTLTSEALTFGGLLAVIPLLIKKVFVINNNCELSRGEQLFIFISSPAVLVGIALSLLAYFI